jgi:hypothetical protein
MYCVAFVALPSCSKSSASRSPVEDDAFPVMVMVRGDARQPLSKAKILSGTRMLGSTDDSGSALLKLKGTEGDSVSLSVKCPDGFASPEKPVVVGLRRLAAGSPAPKFETECVPLLRTIVAGLRTENGPNLPIMRLNQVVGHTDAQGVAHIVLEVSPKQPITLTIDTSGNPNLRPHNPTLTFVPGERDEMVLLEQKFTVVRPAVRARVVNRPTPL